MNYTPVVHPFFELERTDRSRWIAAFCDGSLSPSLCPDLALPLLPRGESPVSWLEDQFRRAEAIGQLSDRLRDSVVDLLCNELESMELGDRYQALGLLVDLASACGFTEVAPKLRDWIRADHYVEVSYKVDGHSIPLRQTLWSAIIGWGGSEDMIPYLKRDLGRPSFECGALCFSALGRLSPADAILEIPSTHAWPSPYWAETLRSFFENFADASRTLVEPHLHTAWQSCLGTLLWDPEVSERFKPRWGEFRKLLADAGLELNELYGEDKIDLRPRERPLAGLRVDFGSLGHETDQLFFTYYQGLIEGAYSFLDGAQGFHP